MTKGKCVTTASKPSPKKKQPKADKKTSKKKSNTKVSQTTKKKQLLALLPGVETVAVGKCRTDKDILPDTYRYGTCACFEKYLRLLFRTSASMFSLARSIEAALFSMAQTYDVYQILVSQFLQTPNIWKHVRETTEVAIQGKRGILIPEALFKTATVPVDTWRRTLRGLWDHVDRAMFQADEREEYVAEKDLTPVQDINMECTSHQQQIQFETGQTICPKCHSSEYLQEADVFNRSGDEGSGKLNKCTRCKIEFYDYK